MRAKPLAIALTAALGLLVAGSYPGTAFADNFEHHGDGYDSDPHGDRHRDSDHDRNRRRGEERHHNAAPGFGFPVVDGTYAFLINSGLEPSASGEAKRRTRGSRDQFEAEVKLPVPSAALGIADATDADLLEVTLVLGNGAGDYAECVLDPRSLRRNHVEYKVQVKTRSGRLRERWGSCDVDLLTPGVQPGLPDVQVGDAISIAVDGQPLFEGAFQ